jgi:hypothetical protein
MATIRRDLTPKQRGFVEAILSGCTKCDAYRQAYGLGNNSAKTIGRNAQRTANSQIVREEISRRTLLSLPQAFDFGVLWQHSIVVLRELTECASDTVKLKAAVALFDAAEAARTLQTEPSGADAERALGKLRDLYRRARTMESRYSPTTRAAAATPEKTFTEERAPGGDIDESDEYSVPGCVNNPQPGAPQRSTCEVRQEVETDACPPDVVSASRGDNAELAELPAMPGIEDLGADRPILPDEHDDRYEWRMVPVPGRFPRRFHRKWVRIR